MAITKAVADKRWRQVRLLTELFYDVNSGDYRGYTPLIQCVYIDDERKAMGVARYLLKHGAKVDINDKSGLNALMHACKIDRERLALLFLNEKDFNLNHCDRHGNTALIYTATTGNILILNKMLAEMKKYKLSIDIANHDGITPLIAAAKHGNILCTRILISVGRASVGIRDNKYHRTAKEWESTRNSRDLAAAKSPLFQLISASSQNSSSGHSTSSSASQSIALPSSPSLATNRRPRSAISHSQQSRPASAIAGDPSAPQMAKKQTRAVSAGPYRRRCLPTPQSLDRPSLSTPMTFLHRQQSNMNKENDAKQVELTPFNKLMLIYQAQCTPSYKMGVKLINEDKSSSGRSISPASTIERENSETPGELSSAGSISKRRMSLSRLVGLTRSRRDSTSSNTSTSSFSKLAKKALAANRSESSSKTSSSPDDGDFDRSKSDNAVQRFRSFSDIRYDLEKSEDDKAKIRSRFTVKFQLPQNKNVDRQDSNDQTTIDDDHQLLTNRQAQPLENSRHRILATAKLVSLYKETKNKGGRERKNQQTESAPPQQSDTTSDQIKDSPPVPDQQQLDPVKSNEDDAVNQSNKDQNTNDQAQETTDDDQSDQQHTETNNLPPQFTYDTIGAINKFTKQFKIIKDQSKIKFPTVMEVEED